MRVKSTQTGAVIAGAIAAMLLASSAQAALVISTDATQNVTCSSGVCSATAADAVLNVTDLANLIASSPVTIQSGNEAQDIVFNAPFSWTSANGLTLDTYRSIRVNATIADKGAAPISIIAPDGESKGGLTFYAVGNITFDSTSNQLSINGKSYSLVDSLIMLAKLIAKNKSGVYALANSMTQKEMVSIKLPPSHFSAELLKVLVIRFLMWL